MTPPADSATTTPARGYSASKDALLKRLKRVEGQVRGVQGMIEDDRYCIDVLTQISAVQAALDKVALGLLDEHARHCVIAAKPGEQDAARDRARGRAAEVVALAVGDAELAQCAHLRLALDALGDDGRLHLG